MPPPRRSLGEDSTCTIRLRRLKPEALLCCAKYFTNTKFCYYNLSDLSQTRHFYKSYHRLLEPRWHLQNALAGGGPCKSAVAPAVGGGLSLNPSSKRPCLHPCLPFSNSSVTRAFGR
ncbi:hypothetical protein NL676_035042 [Syzygium grande]|nr:hypothetical protein NL676_035042 [Syzygium grande]